MKFATVASAASVAAGVSAGFANVTTMTTNHVVTSTEVVSQYTTYCPAPTSFVENNKTYVVTEPTTITVTNCPCTRSKTYTTEYVTVCPVTSGGSVPSAGAPPAAGSGSHKASAPASSGSAHPSSPNPVAQGGAAKAGLASGALAAVVAAAAYLL